MKMFKKIFFVIIAVGCWQCKSKTPANTSTKTTGFSYYGDPNPIPRGMARIVAQVVKIKPINKIHNNTNTICSRNPCEAIIHIEKVIGYGPGFIGKIKNRQQLEAYFIQTLTATKSVLPNRKKNLPGLQKKSRFEADLLFNPKASQTPKYQVMSYQKL